MDDLRFVTDLVLAVLAACVGGVAALRLGQPVILGYLIWVAGPMLMAIWSAARLLARSRPGRAPTCTPSRFWPRSALRF